MNNYIPRFLNLDVSFYIRMDCWHNLVAMTTYPSFALRIELSILFEVPQNPGGISSQSSNSNIHRDKIYSSGKTSVGLFIDIFQYLEGGEGKPNPTRQILWDLTKNNWLVIPFRRTTKHF